MLHFVKTLLKGCNEVDFACRKEAGYRNNCEVAMVTWLPEIPDENDPGYSASVNAPRNKVERLLHWGIDISC